MAGLFTELKRRNVFRVGIFYAIVAWLLLQVSDIVVPAMGIPDWGLRFIMLLLGLGFPIALIFAWAFEITPEGIKLEKDVDRSQSITGHTGRKIDFVIIAVLVLAIALLVAERFLFQTTNDESSGSASTDIESKIEPSVASARTTADRKSIAVIPFDNRSADEEDAEFFSEGIHDDILTLLSKIRDLKVISRTSVQKFKDTDKTIPEIGAELGVATVLEGGVQRAGNRVRINVQLIDVATDEHLWAETYDRELTAENIFDVQGEIAGAVSSALEATLSNSEQTQLKAVPTENLEAYEAYTLAKRKLRRRASAELFEGADLFKKAYELDPGFAQAYAGYAGALLLQESYTDVEYGDVKDRIVWAIDTALDLDPNLAEAYAAKGLMSQYGKDLVEAEKHFKRAIELNPNYVRAYHWYGVILRIYLGRYDEALDMHMKALEMDPLSPIINFNVAADLDALGRSDEAMTIFRRENDQDNASGVAAIGFGWSHWLFYGDYQNAASIFDQAMRRDPGFAGAADTSALVMLDLGMDEKAVKVSNTVSGARQIKVAIEMARAHKSGNHRINTEQIEKTLSLPSTEWDETFGALPAIFQMLQALDSSPTGIARVMALYRRYYPDIFDPNHRRVFFNNLNAALNVARLLRKSGNEKGADSLLRDAAAFLNHRPVGGVHGKGFSEVVLYALQGRNELAIQRLREILDSGYRAYWWLNLKDNPNLESIANDPRFQAMIEEIETDMAQKRAQIEAAEIWQEI